jgi:hypothetical protein
MLDRWSPRWPTDGDPVRANVGDLRKSGSARGYLQPMRRALAAAGIAVALLSSVIGTGPAATRVDAAMSRSGSPVSAGNLPTAEQMSKGLLTLADMPADYTAFGQDETADTTEVPASGWCREAGLDRSAPTPRVYRAFEHPDGTIFAAEIVATGTRKANQLVEAATTVTTRCPVVEGDLTTKKHSRLALPDLGVRAAGVDEMFQDPFGEWSRLYHAVVATGGVTGVYTEMGSHPRHRARFLSKRLLLQRWWDHVHRQGGARQRWPGTGDLPQLRPRGLRHAQPRRGDRRDRPRTGPGHRRDAGGERPDLSGHQRQRGHHPYVLGVVTTADRGRRGGHFADRRKRAAHSRDLGGLG